MKKFFGRIFTFVGVLVTALLLIILVLSIAARASRKMIPQHTVLELNLQQPLVENAPDDLLAKLRGDSKPSLRGTIDAIEIASNDPNVKGMVAKVGYSPMSPAFTQELRDAIKAFRAKKKFAVAWTENFDFGNGGFESYYLATAFDEIWLQTGAFYDTAGMELEQPYARGLLDKLGITPEFEGRKEYKTAIETYMNRAPSPANKEALGKFVGSVSDQMIRAAAEERKLPEQQVRDLINNAPYLAQAALDQKLVDRLGYRDEVYASIQKRIGTKPNFLKLGDYASRKEGIHNKGERIALIYGVGAITQGKSDYDPMQDSQSMGSDTVSKAFRTAREDSKVKAIIFRVDSPGGSAVASETIRRELLLARQAGKPVVISMSSLAASGGYWVSMSADKIVAQPGTLTGSIGVFTGKLVTAGMWDKVGVNWEATRSGKNTGMYNSDQSFTPDELAKLRQVLDFIYSDFTTKVSQGRKLPLARVDEIGKGRIWSGEDAKQIGLVDELGGYPKALQLAKQLAKIKEQEDVDLKVYPPAKSTAELILSAISGSKGDDEADSGEVHSFSAPLRPLLRALREAGVAGRPYGEVEIPAPDWAHRRR